MAIVDLLGLELTSISRNLKGKYLLLYGMPKSGKTSMAVTFPKNLLLATERGYNAIPNIYAVDIPDWSTFKGVLRELKKPEVQEKFNTVTIDTISILWDLCERWVCASNDVENLADILWGQGYKKCEKEFSEALRQITLLGYGIVCITHSEYKNIKTGEFDSKGNEILVETVAPSLTKRPFAIVNRLVDIIGYIYTDLNAKPDDQNYYPRYIVLRETPTVMAGSRYQHVPSEIPFGYESLANTIADAIEKEGQLGGKIVDAIIEEKKRPFGEAMKEAEELFLALSQPQRDIELTNSLYENFGTKTFRLSQTKPEQQSSLEMVIEDMKVMLNR